MAGWATGFNCWLILAMAVVANAKGGQQKKRARKKTCLHKNTRLYRCIIEYGHKLEGRAYGFVITGMLLGQNNIL
jgi:hypothetical protein